MPFQPGQSGNPKGREKGVINKTSATFKQALQETFERLGGVDHLIDWASAEPTEFYKIYAKTLPTEIKGQLNGEKKITVEFVKSKPSDT